MSLINAISIAHYTRMANDAAYSMMKMNNSRMNMISSLGYGMDPGFETGSLESFAAMDTQMELDTLSLSLQYQMAKAMLEQLKKQQKEDAKKFNLFA